MAVARAELTPREWDFVMTLLDRATKKEKIDNKRAVRELKRAHKAAHDTERNELAHLAKMRAALPTAPQEEEEDGD